MAKVIVTPELADVLRDIRLKNKVQAKMLAEHIEKSPAYITKLEKGAIQTLSNEEFISILEYISKDAIDFEDMLERVFKELKIKYTDEEINNQIWFLNFDMIQREIPVPEELVSEINTLIQSFNTNRDFLFNKINTNEGIAEAERDDSSIPFNEWYHSALTDNDIIKIRLDYNTFIAFLDNKLNTISYIYPYSILTYLYKIDFETHNNDSISRDFSAFQIEARKILNKHKFYTLQEKDAISNSSKTQEEIDSLLTSFDIENREIINDILSGFRFLADSNIIITNERLKLFADNMRFDLGFMLKIISMDYVKLSSITVGQKKNFIEDLSKLIDEYSAKSASPEELDIELY